MECLLAVTRGTRILSNIYSPSWFRGVYGWSLEIIQLMLTHWSFDLSLKNKSYGFTLSQHTVYAHPQVQPLFLDAGKNEMNVGYFLHVVNFFKYHFTTKDEQTAFREYKALDKDEKLKGWNKPLTQGLQKLGSNWHSSYGRFSRL